MEYYNYTQAHLTAQTGYLREKDAYIKVLQDFSGSPKNMRADYPALDKVIELRSRGFLRGSDIGTPSAPAYADVNITFSGRKYLVGLTAPAKA